MDVGDITDQEQAVEAEDEQERQEEENDQGAVNLAMDEDVNIVENSVGGEPSYQVGSMFTLNFHHSNDAYRCR